MHILLSILLFFGTATVFSENDEHNPNPNLACLHRPLKQNESAAAHRTLPCGTILTVFNPRTGLHTDSIVKDRGPYGRYKTGEYKSDLDITPAVAKKIKHNGMEPVIFLIKERHYKVRKRAPNS